MYGSTAKARFAQTLEEIREAGLYKDERVLTSPQQSAISVSGGANVINFCANNYLGLSNHPELVAAARRSLDEWGFGLSSVRFICGTQEIHKELERRLSGFLGFEDTILYASCFDANGGLFETLLGPEDAIISDALNHASIIDGVRLCKAKRFVYKTSDMGDLEAQPKEAGTARTKVIATDGVFSMDGTIANLQGICDLADKYDALVMVDDCHAVGFLGKNGRGTHEFHDVMGRVDIMTGTLGKALGGATGGYTASRGEVVELLRQRSRPYLFSNSVAPNIVAASLAALDLLERDTSLRDTLADNTAYFREKIAAVGLDVPEGNHPIVPVMLGEARLAHEMADRLLERGVYVIGFSYPVVPKGTARIRVQISAGHTREELDYAVEQFAAVKKELNI
ncbi:MAG TPA: glycine C-acetyltransferase [Spirochaetia bacterium]|nr:glycine C-acetyltransferase [Spirochaetia bacterium]